MTVNRSLVDVKIKPLATVPGLLFADTTVLCEPCSAKSPHDIAEVGHMVYHSG